jgi:VCBS repeat-containing protein
MTRSVSELLENPSFNGMINATDPLGWSSSEGFASFVGCCSGDDFRPSVAGGNLYFGYSGSVTVFQEVSVLESVSQIKDFTLSFGVQKNQMNGEFWVLAEFLDGTGGVLTTLRYPSAGVAVAPVTRTLQALSLRRTVFSGFDSIQKVRVSVFGQQNPRYWYGHYGPLFSYISLYDGLKSILSDIDISGTEDIPLNFSSANFSPEFTDPENPTLSSVQIVTLPTTGVLSLNGNPVSANQVVQTAELNALTYQPAANENGVVSFTVIGSNGIRSSDSAIVRINLAPVNDAPVVGSTASVAYSEKGSGVAIDPTLSIADVDDSNLSAAIVSIESPVSGDLLSYAPQDGISGSFDPVTGTLTLTGSAPLATYLTVLRSVVYSSSSSNPTAGGTRPNRTVRWTVTDANSSGAANGAQTSIAGDLVSRFLTDSVYTLAADGANPFVIPIDLGQNWTFQADYRAIQLQAGWVNTVFSYGQYTDGILVRTLRGDALYLKKENFGDIDIFGGTSTGNGFVSVTIQYTSSGGVGTLRVEANGVLLRSITAPVPLDPADKTIRLGSAHHSQSEGFNGQIKNIRISRGTTGHSTQSSIAITPINDTPTIDSTGFQLLYETTNPSRDSSGAIVYSLGYGTASSDAAARFAASGLSINRIRYRMELTVSEIPRFAQVTFDGWTGVQATDLRIPDDTAANEFVLQRDVSNLSVESNYQTVGTGSGFTGRLELWPYNYAPQVTDPFQGGRSDLYDLNDTYAVTGNGYGSFQVHNVTRAETVLAWNMHRHGGPPEIGFGNNSNGQPDWTGATLGSLDWKLQISADSSAVPPAFLLTEDTLGNLAFHGTPFADLDGDPLTVTLAVDDGSLITAPGNGVQIGGVEQARTLTGSVPDLNAYFTTAGNIRYLPPANGSGNRTLTTTVSDGVLSTAVTSVLSVAPVNDAPLNTVPAAQTVSEDTALAFSGSKAITVVDVDSARVTAQVTVTQGNLTVTLGQTGATVSAGANGSSTLTLSGTVAQVNGALATLVYQGNPNISGGDTLTLLTTDEAGLTDIDTVALTVTPVNDAPTLNLGISAAGGAKTTSGQYTVHTFTAASDIFIPASSGVVEVLVVGGGGGGGGSYVGGGGGGGGVLSSTSYAVTAGESISVLVGGGGKGGGFGTRGATGGTSQFGSLVAVGGGGGGGFGPYQGLVGGSGGGAGWQGVAGAGVDGQGYSGGAFGTTPSNHGGGGGGAGGTPDSSGVGGMGVSSSISGSTLYYAGGGAAGTDDSLRLAGGLGGGGAGGDGNYSNGNGSGGVENTGGGGGGGGGHSAALVGGDGGSGVVIVRYRSNAISYLDTLANDTFADVSGVLSGADVDLGTVLTYGISGATLDNGTATKTGTYGRLTVTAATGEYTFTPNALAIDALSAPTTEIFAVTVSDGLTTTTADWVIDLTGVADAPVNSVPAAQTVAEDTALAFSGSKALSVVDVDSARVTAQVTVTQGNLTVTLGQTGATVSAGANASSTLTVSGTVAQVNGALATLVYRGNPNTSGNDTLTLLTTDEAGLTDTDTVALNVTPVNDAPTLVAISVNGTEDTTLTFPLSGFPGAYSDPEGTALSSITVVTLPSSGTLLLSGIPVTAGQVISSATLANLTYVPAAHENGAKTFTVTVSDGALSSPVSTVTLNLAPVDDAPVANGSATLASVDEGSGSTAPGDTVGNLFSATFSDAADGGQATLVGIAITRHTSDAARGSWQYSSDGQNWTTLPQASSTAAVTLKASDRLRFVPASNYNGSASPLEARLVESGGAVMVSGAVINLVGTGPQVSLSRNSVIGWSSIYSSSFSADRILDNQSGAVSVDSFGNNYWLASDRAATGHVILDLGTATDLSQVALYNTSNTDFGDRGTLKFHIEVATAITGSTATSYALVNPITAASGVLVDATVGVAPTAQTFDLNTAGVIPRYVRFVVDSSRNNNPGLNEIRLFSVNALAGGSTVYSLASVPLLHTVNPVNDAPVAVDQAVTIEEDKSQAITLSGVDVDGDVLTYSVVSKPLLGTLTGTAPNLVYEPNANANGTDSFTFRVSDGSLVSALATISITIKPVNDAPVLALVNPLSGGIEDTDYTITYAALAAAADESDVDSSSVSFRIEGVTSGTLTRNGTAVVPGSTVLAVGESLSWRPALNANGLLEAFTIRAWDGQLASATAVPVTVSVTAVPDEVSVEGLTAVSKVYDGTRVASVSGTPRLVGLPSGVDVQIQGTPVFTLAQATVGTSVAIQVSDLTLVGAQAADYTMVLPQLVASITPKPISIEGLTGVTKVYDGTTAATVSGTAVLSGVVSGDEGQVTLSGTPVFTLASAKVGTGIAINTSGYTLSGSRAGNYSLSQPTMSATITTDGLVGSQLIAFSQSSLSIPVNQQVTINQSSQLPSGAIVERVVFSFEYATYWSSSAVAGNYVKLNGVDLPELGWTSLGTGNAWRAETRTYLGTLPAFNRAGANVWLIGSAWNPVSLRNATMTLYYWLPGKLSQTLAFDPLADVTYGVQDIPLTASASSGLSVDWEVASGPGQLVGSSLKVLGAGSIVVRATQAGDSVWYAAPPVERTLVVGKKALSVTSPTVVTKAYDGTVSATINGTLSGVLTGDAVTLVGTGTFAGKNAGVDQGVTSTSTLSGAAAGNYTLTQPTGLKGTIMPKALSIGAPTIASKVYDGTTTAGVVTVGALSGLVGSETLTVTGTAAPYGSAAVGTYPSVVVTYTLANGGSGNTAGLAANYSLAAGTASGTITAKDLVIAVDPASLVQDFDGNPRTVLWTTTPAGIPVSVLYNGSTSPPKIAGSYPVTLTSADPNYSARLTVTLVIRKTLQGITLNAAVVAAGLQTVADASGRFLLQATLGQPIAGTTTGATGMRLDSGFWFTEQFSAALEGRTLVGLKSESKIRGADLLRSPSVEVPGSPTIGPEIDQPVTGKQPLPRLVVMPMTASGEVWIRISGVPADRWLIQYQDRLHSDQWFDESPVELDADGAGAVRASTGVGEMRFYRLVQP